MAGPIMKRGVGARYRPMAEINVTPMVDVMLVLLIIFMVAAPMMTSGVPVDLPKTTAQPLNQEQEPITISVDPQGRIFLQETEVQLENLVQQLQAIGQTQQPGQPERRIFVRGDRGISYGRVMEVMGTISAGGFTRVALLAEQANPTAARPGAPAAPTGAPPPRSRPHREPPGARRGAALSHGRRGASASGSAHPSPRICCCWRRSCSTSTGAGSRAARAGDGGRVHRALRDRAGRGPRPRARR